MTSQEEKDAIQVGGIWVAVKHILLLTVYYFCEEFHHRCLNVLNVPHA